MLISLLAILISPSPCILTSLVTTLVGHAVVSLVRTTLVGHAVLSLVRTTSGAGEYAGIIDYKHGSNVMTFGISGNERLRITEGAAEQATLVIDNAGTNGNTWIEQGFTFSYTDIEQER